MKKIFWLVLLFSFLALPKSVFGYQIDIVSQKIGDTQILNPEVSQRFFDELKGEPKNYIINSDKDFILNVSLLIPEPTTKDNGFYLEVYSVENGQDSVLVPAIDFTLDNWQEEYDSFGRDFYLKNFDTEQNFASGDYKIKVWSENNQGKYILAMGQKEPSRILPFLNLYWQVPWLKMTFLKTSVLQFFLTPAGITGIGIIGSLLVLLTLIYYIAGVIRGFIKHNMAKTLLLASNTQEMKDEILDLLQKPAYDVNVGFISTAAKAQEDVDYVRKDWMMMRDELGFNLEEIDIEGKTESQLMRQLSVKDIIFVEGGNTFYLLNAMRKCNFEKVVRKLLKLGKVYVGVSAGAMVAGKTIITSVWRSKARGINRNVVGLKNLKGLNLLPFDIFVHYEPEYAEIIKKEMPDPKKRQKNLKIITDQQAIFVQNKEIMLIGDGEEVIV